MKAGHLARRFLGSLRPGGPGPAAETWVGSLLNEGERALWCSMSGPDRRHAVAVARRVQRRLGDGAERAVLTAALLHDVGKVEAALGTLRRVVATLAAGRLRRLDRGHPALRRPTLQRMAAYVRHDQLGADLLRAAGSHPLAVTWAREHHLRPEAWTLPPHLAAALKAADDD